MPMFFVNAKAVLVRTSGLLLENPSQKDAKIAVLRSAA
jgi:hypothetical protein